MKAQCERCKEIVPLEFVVEEGGVLVKCGACRAEYFVAGAEKTTGNGQPATGNRQPAAGEMICPKCGAGQAAAEACRRCGLVVSKWDPEKADAVFGDVKEARELWAAVEAEWDRGELHDRFIDECKRSGVLAYAAARYRQRGAQDRLAQIRMIAEQTLAAAPRPEIKRGRSRTLLLLAMVVIILAMGYMLMSGFSVPE